MWCYIAALFLDKSMDGLGKPDYPEKAQIAAVLKTAIGGMTDAAMVARGITSQSRFNAYREQRAEALFDNRLDKVIAACPTQ